MGLASFNMQRQRAAQAKAEALNKISIERQAEAELEAQLQNELSKDAEAKAILDAEAKAVLDAVLEAKELINKAESDKLSGEEGNIDESSEAENPASVQAPSKKTKPAK
tara:strand:- start:40 stop:366 length:327 start_codon:yes stop_codon:yes gene_type:complete